MKKIQKLKLDFEEEDSMDAIGISTSYSDFRLAWTLNHFFDWKFELCENPLLVPDRKTKEERSFHYHHYVDYTEKMQLFLIKNKQEGKPLFEDFLQFDFVLFFKNNLSIEIEQLLQLLRKLDPIIAAYRCSSNDFTVSSYLHFEGIYE